MQRQQTTLTLSVPPDTKERLVQLASSLGLLWGEKPSPSKLVAAIAEGTVAVGVAASPDAEEAAALLAAIRLLQDQGETNKARALVQLIIARGGLPEDILHQLYDELAQGALPWRAAIEQAISRREPILITYQGFKPEPSTYLARFVEIRSRMGNWYADIRTADGVANSSDIPGLEENRCLRLERVLKVAPVFHPLGWATEGLATVVADLRFFNDSAKHYRRHPDDLSEEMVGEGSHQVRRVRRRVSNGWWFAREIVAQGPDVVVDAPKDLADAVKERLRASLKRYVDLRRQ